MDWLGLYVIGVSLMVAWLVGRHDAPWSVAWLFGALWPLTLPGMVVVWLFIPEKERDL